MNPHAVDSRRAGRLALRTLVASACAALLAAGAPAQDDYWTLELVTGRHSLLRGKLAEARARFEEIVAARAEDAVGDRPDDQTARLAHQGLLELDLIRGAYAEVRAAVEALPAAERDDPGYRALLGRAHERVGEYERAGELYAAMAAADSADLAARFALGRVRAETGAADAARQVWQQVVDAHANGLPDDPIALAWLGNSLIELGGRDNLERASQVLVASIEAGPDRPEARTALGLLKLEVYAEADGLPSGEKDLQKVLEQNGEVEEALIGLYRLRRSNLQLDPDKTEQYLSRALALNPNSVPALMERGALMLQDRRFELAAETFDRALEVNPHDKRVLAHRAAAALLMREPEKVAELRARALAVDPTFSDGDRILGDHLVALYRFADAVPCYERALGAAPDSIPALHGLAKALIYTGRGADAVKVLQRAAELQQGFVNPWRSNALAVEDLLKNEYLSVDGAGFRFQIHRDDFAVLVEYLPEHHQMARDVLGEKYGYRPDEDVRVEVLHTWADFSVRTIGFRGFSALGACFGRFITLVSPSDDLVRRQDFMWAATVWHEYAHVLTLALSRHRVPRWLTEGFSVYEEGQRDPTWERGMDRELFDAYHNREIAPVGLLNRLFRGPRILFGYYQGGLIVEFLAAEYGFDKVVEMLRGYGEDRSTEALFDEVFGIDTAEFDRRFLEFVRSEKLRGLNLVPRYSDRSIERLMIELVRDSSDLEARVDLGWAYAQRGNAIDAGNQVRLVLASEPNHGRALLLHAELLAQRKALDAARDAYVRGFAAGADDFDSRIRFGRLLEALDDTAGAIDQYQRAKACWPKCTDRDVAPNLLLARLLRKLGRGSDAMMELESFVARTGRAFAPRLELAAMARELGNRGQEAKLLEQAVWIDPFMRELHVRLAEALVALGEKDRAVREYRAALAVRPQIDRAYLGQPPDAVPAPDSPGEREARARICVELGKLCHSLARDAEARDWLDRALREAPGSESAEEAQLLIDAWGR